MEKLTNTSILRFHPDTLEYVRKEFGLDNPGVIESLKILHQWLAQQEHFVKKDFSIEYTERFLICCKGSVEKTKEKLEKMCTVRTTHRKFFENYDAEANHVKELIIDALLPSLTPKHERIYFAKNVGTKDLMGFYRRFVKVAEYTRRYDYFVGVHVIADLSAINIMELVAKIKPFDLLSCITIGISVFSMPLKSIHLVTPSKFIEILVKILKQAMSTKLRQRIHVHQTIDPLFEIFPRNMMPKDYGGSEKNLHELNDDLSEAIASDEFVEYLNEMSRAVIDEKLRRKISYFEKTIGVLGFRKLTID